MKKMLLPVFLIGAKAFAGFPVFKVSGISGSYQDRRGVAFAEHASYDLDVVRVEHNQIEVNFNNIEKNLVINDHNTKVRLGFDFSFLNLVDSGEFKGVNANSEPRKFTAHLEELKLFVEPSSYVLTGVSAESDLENNVRDLDDLDILEGFITKGEVRVDQVSTAPSSNENLAEEVLAENPQMEKELKALLATGNSLLPVIGRHFLLSVKDGVFRASVLLDSYLNAWMNLGGKMTYQKKDKVLIIQVKRAKLGLFSVQRYILGVVRRLSLQGVRVEDDRIIVDFEMVAGSGASFSK